MFQVTLFLGAPIEGDLASALQRLDPVAASMFIGEGAGDYLTYATVNGMRYIGKFAGDSAGLAALDLLQNHIRSLLAKVVSDPALCRPPLTLIAVPKPEPHV
jgi:hypothetical protein